MSAVRVVGTLEERDLECGVCFNILRDPVSIPCGHTLCRTCLQQTLAVKRNCPFCRAYCHVDAYHASTNALIQHIILKAFPQYELHNTSRSSSTTTTTNMNLPLFIALSLNFPAHTLHLHIFEMRYRFMVNQCMNTHRQFVVTTPLHRYTSPVGRDSMRNVPSEELELQSRLEYGCIVKIKDCAPLADGRSMLTAVIGKRVVLENVQRIDNAHGLACADVKEFQDDLPLYDEKATEEEKQHVDQYLNYLREESIRKVDLFLKLQGSSLQKFLELEGAAIPDNLADASLWIPGIVFSDRRIEVRKLKTQIFKSRDIAERLHLCDQLLDVAIEKEKLAKKIRSLFLLAIILIVAIYGYFSQN